MGVTDHIKRKTRRESFEPQPLHIPAPEQGEPRKDNQPVDDKAGTHVTVIDIS
jgi:hypothetical protein